MIYDHYETLYFFRKDESLNLSLVAVISNILLYDIQTYHWHGDDVLHHSLCYQFYTIPLMVNSKGQFC